MRPLFAGIPAVTESRVKGKGRPRSYKSYRELAETCQSITHTVYKDGEVILTLVCEGQRGKWEGAKFVRDLLRRKVCDEIRTQYKY